MIFKGAKFHYHTITVPPETELPFPVDALQCHMSVHLKDALKYLNYLCLPFVYFARQNFVFSFPANTLYVYVETVVLCLPASPSLLLLLSWCLLLRNHSQVSR